MWCFLSSNELGLDDELYLSLSLPSFSTLYFAFCQLFTLLFLFPPTLLESYSSPPLHESSQMLLHHSEPPSTLETFVPLRVYTSTSGLFVDANGCPSALRTVEAMEGRKEGDVQIKAEECAVKNLQIRLGLTLIIWLLERERERALLRRERKSCQRCLQTGASSPS